MTDMPLNFPDEPTRRQWLIDNADYFTVIRRQNRKYEREEFHSLTGAEQAANRMVERDPSLRLMIYAVYDVHDTYVKTIQAGKADAG